ncbi:MAG: hypothetical protein Q9209_004262 [Squamulea sp. 1 TL-2023]
MSEVSDNNASVSISPALEKSRGRNDSLWKRARRTLGTNSLSFLQSQGKPVSGMLRKEVMGLARAKNYIKTLESEVVRLRGSEGDLMSENKKLCDQVDILRTALILNDVPLPASFEDSSQLAQPPLLSSELPASVSFKTDNSNHQRLHVDWPTRSYQQPATKPGSGNPRSHPGCNPTSKPLPVLPKDFDSTFETPPPRVASRDLDTAEVAVDFVLALEHICMPHIPHPGDPPSDEPTNHALLMSTALTARAPGPPQPSSSWKANGSMIKELLNLASAINLQGEITPVEAWHRLRQHPGFSRLDKWALEKIKGDLSTSVRCCDFGAVLDENVFLFTLGTVLGPA